jgi:hypothetical protein
MPDKRDIDRRAEPRIAVKRPGRLFYGPALDLWVDCVIRDQSQLGVKIEVSKLFKLPERAVLADLQDGVAFDVLVKWRRRDMAGLQFEVRYDLRGVLAERLYTVRDTWLALGGGGPREG